MNIPQSIVGLVGPNGCGKSNIIDAVRWVMGESAATHLRGANMEDVIFNGSSKRKPVNQAMVELLFDNQSGRVEGPWAQYQEISVRRTVERGGGSNYYINNTKCRRKDVMDIFLGTGLGPRSYSIIGQGMISRVIEAKPEELRNFIEEAAGVSRYKERRRETENRIRHTEDNLSRVNDLTQEVEKQAARAERQAKAAKRFRELRESERQYRQCVFALEHAEHSALLTELTQQRTALEQDIIARQTELRGRESHLISKKSEDMAAQQTLDEAQKQYYEHKSEVEKLEQKIEMIKSAQQKADKDALNLAKERKELQQKHGQIQNQLADSQEELNLLGEQLTEREAQREVIAEQRDHAREALQSAEQALRDHEQAQSKHDQNISLLSLQLQQAEKELERSKAEIDKLQHEKQALLDRNADSEEQTNPEALAELEATIAQLDEDIHAKETEAEQASAHYKVKQSELASLQNQQSERRGKLDALRALQRKQLSAEDAKKKAQIPSHYTQAPHLTEMLAVDEGWERAVEVVFTEWLSARVVGKLPNEADAIHLINDGLGVVIDQQKSASSMDDISTQSEAIGKLSGYPKLADHIQSAPASVIALCQHIYVTSTLAEALSIVQDCQVYESVITSSGQWVTPLGIKPADQTANQEQSLLYRQRQIAELEAVIAKDQQSSTSLDKALKQAEQQQKSAEQTLQALHQQRAGEQSTYSKLSAEHAARVRQLDEREQRIKAIDDAVVNLEESQTELAAKIEQTQSDLQAAQLQREEMAQDYPDQQSKKVQAEVDFSEIDQQYTQHQDQLQKEQLRHTRLEASVQTLTTQRQDLEARIAKIESQENQALAHDQREELERLRSTLSEKAEALKSYEAEVNTLRESAKERQQHLSELETTISELREALTTKEQEKQSLLLQESEQRQQAQYQESRLSELGVSLVQAKKNLQSLDLTLDQARAQADSLKQKIDQMGSVNLQAIDEHKELSERLTYLHEQIDDLNEALATLKDAIASIDQETKARFEETYHAVNEQIKVLFPKLFGGGQGYLELTSDDLLTAGVRIIAKPPGKTPSSIHLLSGGEKALTAAALVFAIFQLNPSPFCMLDEVDAPLDDANVGRFCELVKSLSDRVQFIIVTHNKVTMEMAEQLSGVTMGEPGVSRLVSVNIDDAVAMAA